MKNLRLIFILILTINNFAFAEENKPTLVDSFTLSVTDLTSGSLQSSNASKNSEGLIVQQPYSSKEVSSMNVQVSQWSNGETIVEGSGLTSSLDQPTSFDYKIDLDARTIEITTPVNIDYVRRDLLEQSNFKIGTLSKETITPSGETIELETSTDGFSKQQIKDVRKALKRNDSTREAAISLSPELYSAKIGKATTLATAAAIRPGWHYRGVMVTTLDPVNVALTRTGTSTLWCVYPSGLQNWFQATRRNWAANPSSFNTHWFVASIFFNSPRPNYWTTSPLRSFNNASYYNDDFLFDNLRTNVTQVVNLAARNDGVAAYSWRHADSGEGHVYIRGSLSFY